MSSFVSPVKLAHNIQSQQKLICELILGSGIITRHRKAVFLVFLTILAKKALQSITWFLVSKVEILTSVL